MFRETAVMSLQAHSGCHCQCGNFYAHPNLSSSCHGLYSKAFFPPLWPAELCPCCSPKSTVPPQWEPKSILASQPWGEGWGSGLAVPLPTHLGQFSQSSAIGRTLDPLLLLWRLWGQKGRHGHPDSAWSKKASPGQLISVGVPMMAPLGNESPTT